MWSWWIDIALSVVAITAVSLAVVLLVLHHFTRQIWMD